jgi:HSP20 family protein
MSTSVPTRRPATPGSLIQGWDPFRELEQLHRQTAELMGGLPAGGVWAPPVDIEETDDAWLVEAELPGVKKADMNVDVRDTEVVIKGELKERERKGILRRRTRRVGEFEFRVTLPGEIDADGVKANLNDGVLTVRIPKAEPAQARHIEVGGNGA